MEICLYIFLVCWSPKGKQLAVCTSQRTILLLNHELDIKADYECLDSNLTRKFGIFVFF